MDIREWRGSTAKLYLALLFNPAHCGPQALLMERMGTSDKATFLAARKQLEEVGIAYREEGITYLKAAGNPTYVYAFHTPQAANPTPQSLPEVVNPTSPEANPTSVEELPTSPRSRCAVADRSGERATQLEALAFAFAQRFAGHNVPSTESLKRLLQLAGSAEAVDEVFESASTRKIEHPFSYVRAVLERTQQKPIETAIGPTSRPSAPAEEELPEATAEQRARWRANDEKLRRLGILPTDGGDAW